MRFLRDLRKVLMYKRYTLRYLPTFEKDLAEVRNYIAIDGFSSLLSFFELEIMYLD